MSSFGKISRAKKSFSNFVKVVKMLSSCVKKLCKMFKCRFFNKKRKFALAKLCNFFKSVDFRKKQRAGARCWKILTEKMLVSKPKFHTKDFVCKTILKSRYQTFYTKILWKKFRQILSNFAKIFASRVVLLCKSVKMSTFKKKFHKFWKNQFCEKLQNLNLTRNRVDRKRCAFLYENKLVCAKFEKISHKIWAVEKLLKLSPKGEKCSINAKLRQILKTGYRDSVLTHFLSLSPCGQVKVR